MTKLIDNRDLCGKFPQFNFLWLFLSFSQMNVETPTYKALSGITVKPKGFLWPYYDCRHNNHSNLNCISNEPNYTHIPCPSSLLCFTLSHTVAYFRCLVLFFLCVLWFCTYFYSDPCSCPCLLFPLWGKPSYMCLLDHVDESSWFVNI